MTEPRTEAAPTFANTGVLTHHDPGCHCWPHVSERDALDAIAATGLGEYRDGKRAVTAALERLRAVVEGEWPEYIDHLVAGTSALLVLDYIKRDLLRAIDKEEKR